MRNFKIEYTGSSKLIRRIIEKLNNVPILGTGHEDAYYGDQGEAAYQHSRLREGNPHNVTPADLGLGDVPKQMAAIQAVIGMRYGGLVFHGESAGERIPAVGHDGRRIILRTYRRLLAWH